MAEIRLAELREACKHLAVSHLELLGYHDSGMPDWEYKDRPDAFCNVPLDEVAGRIGALIEQYRPQVVITYDDEGAYQHPDHVHAARSAVAAVEATGIPDKLYLTAMRRSHWRELWEALREQGVEVPDDREIDEQMLRQMEEAERRITTNIDIRAVLDRKRAALLVPRQPDPGLLVQQDPAGPGRAGVRLRELHPGQRPHGRAGPRGRPVRGDRAETRSAPSGPA